MLTLFGVLAAAIGCALTRHPSRRAVWESKRPDGTIVRCYEPPAEVVSTALRAEVEARIPEILDLLNARAGFEETFTRLEETLPSLGAVEALEFRLCMAWAQGLLDEGGYREFLAELLPLLKERCHEEE